MHGQILQLAGHLLQLTEHLLQLTEHLLQLAGHLHSQALQEWNLMGSADKVTNNSAVKSLKARLDPGKKLKIFATYLSRRGDSLFHGWKRLLKWHMVKMTWMASNIYFPQDNLILVHQSHVKACPKNFPGGFYWYGGRRRGVGKPPQWVEDLLADQLSYQSTTANGESEVLTQITW